MHSIYKANLGEHCSAFPTLEIITCCCPCNVFPASHSQLFFNTAVISVGSDLFSATQVRVADYICSVMTSVLLFFRQACRDVSLSKNIHVLLLLRITFSTAFIKANNRGHIYHMDRYIIWI